VEEAEAKKATVNSIIIFNVTEKVLTYIQNINNPEKKSRNYNFSIIGMKKKNIASYYSESITSRLRTFKM